MGNYLLETKDFINYVFNYFAMKFQFAFDISREIAYAKCLLARNLGKMLNEKLQEKFCSEMVDMFFIIFVCKSPIFMILKSFLVLNITQRRNGKEKIIFPAQKCGRSVYNYLLR